MLRWSGAVCVLAWLLAAPASAQSQRETPEAEAPERDDEQTPASESRSTSAFFSIATTIHLMQSVLATGASV